MHDFARRVRRAATAVTTITDSGAGWRQSVGLSGTGRRGIAARHIDLGFETGVSRRIPLRCGQTPDRLGVSPVVAQLKLSALRQAGCDAFCCCPRPGSWNRPGFGLLDRFLWKGPFFQGAHEEAGCGRPQQSGPQMSI